MGDKPSKSPAESDDATLRKLLDAAQAAESYLAPRVVGTGGDGERNVLPALRTAIAAARDRLKKDKPPS
jgi:hypothetical protein